MGNVILVDGKRFLCNNGTRDWGLGVVLTHVVYSRHGRLASECCVRTVVVVMVQPLRERPTAFLVRPIELGIGPLGEQGLDEALGFAVGLGPVGADDLVTDLQAGDGFPEGARGDVAVRPDRKSTRLNSSHANSSYA